MNGLTTVLLSRAFRTYLTLAYPHGCVPPSKRPYLEVQPDQLLESLLAPPVCQALPAANGGIRGYAFRLGSVAFPHVKVQVIDCGRGTCVFGVDTHDMMNLPPNHPDSARWAQLQVANRRLKQQVESAWEAEGLVTFNRLLRDGLDSA